MQYKLNYQSNLGEFVKRLNDEPYLTWLDSCADMGCEGRYDILGFSPLVILSQEGKLTEIIQSNQRQQKAGDFFFELQEILKTLPTDTANELPLEHGAMGYLGYDLARQIEHLPEQNQKTSALPDALMCVYQHLIVTDHQKKTTTLISTNNITAELQQRLEQPNPATLAPFKITSEFVADDNEQTYQGNFNRLKQHILDGDCYQANLCQRFAGAYQGDPLAAYLELRQQHPAPFAALQRCPQGSVLSLSPERFLKVRDNWATSQPIKGTIARSTDPLEDQRHQTWLKSSEKNRAENIMIVDLLRNDMSRNCIPTSITVDSLCELKTFSHVHHLVSTISGKLHSTTSSLALLKDCFPGGSITGAPKIRAMEIIETLEPVRRGIYCGSIGYLNANGNFDCNIVIRSLFFEKNNVYAYAGGAITHDSQAQAEYQECFDKIKPLIDCLQDKAHA